MDDSLFDLYIAESKEDLLLAKSYFKKNNKEKALVKVHTCKGSSLFMGDEILTSLCHEIEDLILLNEECVELLNLALEHLSKLTQAPKLKEVFSVKELFSFQSDFFKELQFDFELMDFSLRRKTFSAFRFALRELIKNSIAHSKKDLDELIISICALSKNGYYYFKYSDNGVGIQGNDIFKRKAVKEKASYLAGRGVGLYSVKEKMDELGIELVYKNKTFSFKGKNGLC